MADFTINAGELRTRITFQAPETSMDLGGAQTLIYKNVPANPIVWARWINAHGHESVTSDAFESVQYALVTVRHRTDIQTTWQLVKDDGSIWKIVALDPVQGRNRWIEMKIERTKGSM